MRIIRKNKHLINTKLEKKRKKKIICPQCKRIFYGKYSFNCHPCEDTRYRISGYIQKAREKYKEQGFITSKQASALLSCQPAQDLCQQVGKKLQLSTNVVDFALNMIKSFEREKGMLINPPPLPVKIASGALYIACINNDIEISQEKIAKAFRSTPFTMKKGAALIIKCDFYKEVGF